MQIAEGQAGEGGGGSWPQRRKGKPIRGEGLVEAGGGEESSGSLKNFTV